MNQQNSLLREPLEVSGDIYLMKKSQISSQKDVAGQHFVAT